LADGECGHGEPPAPILPCLSLPMPAAKRIFGEPVSEGRSVFKMDRGRPNTAARRDANPGTGVLAVSGTPSARPLTSTGSGATPFGLYNVVTGRNEQLSFSEDNPLSLSYARTSD
jgi:hypothetical protein